MYPYLHMDEWEKSLNEHRVIHMRRLVSSLLLTPLGVLFWKAGSLFYRHEGEDGQLLSK